MEIKQFFTQLWINIFFYIVMSYVLNYLMNDFKGMNSIFNKQDYVVAENSLPNGINSIFGKNTSNKHDNLLDEVIGLNSVKDEIKYYFDFINNGHKYINWDVKIPRGVLLVGPPGTGKTLLVKTIAKNSGIPVIHTSGSDFVEMFVGVGASRIRSLFNKAKSMGKCIIFIDEIDAVGKKRGMDHNSEREQTLNQLLTEMDGFGKITKKDKDSTIMIFAATNLVRDLDPALLRSGRFDKKVYFDLPNRDERKELFTLYILGIDNFRKLNNDNINFYQYEWFNNSFNTTYLGEVSIGLSGADISNVVNQAKINAIKGKKINFNNTDVVEAIDEVMIGREKRERTLNKEELERVSYHEAGHALISYLVDGLEPPIKVSIIPRGEAALGFSMQRPVDRKLYTDSYLIKQILVLLGGRVSEMIFYDDLSSGASDDIEKVTQLSEFYFKNFGMSKKYGPLNFNNLGKQSLENFGTFNLNEDIIKFTGKIESICFSLLNNNINSLEIIADLLLNKETIDYQDLNKNLNNSIENSIKLNMTIFHHLLEL